VSAAVEEKKLYEKFVIFKVKVPAVESVRVLQKIEMPAIETKIETLNICVFY